MPNQVVSLMNMPIKNIIHVQQEILENILYFAEGSVEKYKSLQMSVGDSLQSIQWDDQTVGMELYMSLRWKDKLG